MSTRNTSAERRVLAAIRRRRAEVDRLTGEISRLQGQLAELRRRGVSGEPVSRTSSTTRLIVEHAVLGRLAHNSGGSTPSGELWLLLQPLGVKSRSTFRSHLRRMKERGLIASPRTGSWILAPGVTVNREVPDEVRRAMERMEATGRRSPGRVQGS